MKRPAYTYAQIQRAKLRALLGLKIAAIIAAALLFWPLVSALMWAAYYAGVPM